MRTPMQLDDFREVWCVTFESGRPRGECPTPFSLVARERRSGRRVGLGLGELPGSSPPYPLGPDTIFVAYDAPAALGCHLALGWPLPARVLDLHAEFRLLTSGLEVPGSYELADALGYHGLGGTGSDAHQAADLLAMLLSAMAPGIDLPRALLRGRYTAAVARMEAVGVPIDMETFGRLREGWDHIKDALIEQVDRPYGVFQGQKFIPRRWAAWVNRNAVPWPRLAPGRLDLSLDTFRDMALAYPEVRPMKDLLRSLSRLRQFRLEVGPDGRNRCPLRPFVSKTGRNQPSAAAFIFGPAAWLRGLIRPGPGRALAYLDYEQQEFGIAAALSKDEAMQEAYGSGDPYLTFAKQAGAVPTGATKRTHVEERERFKLCAIGVQYGMRDRSLAVRLRASRAAARELLRLHRETYPTFWHWSREVGRVARRDGRLRAAFGWTVHAAPGANPRSLRNFPMQANGAEMLRLACCALTEGGVRVCAPVHDAVLVEAPAADIDRVVAECRGVMAWASRQVLRGFTLRAEAKVVRHPDRYMDPRGRGMWDRVMGLLERDAAARCA
jgi:hypothetical protein